MAQYIRHGNGQYEGDEIPGFPEDLDVIFGDIISFNNYRDTATYFVGKNNTLIKNPDFLGSGYLTVPIEVTTHFTNAYKHYEHIIKEIGPATSLVLGPNDKWLVKKYGKFPDGWIITIFPGVADLDSDEDADYININFDNGRQESFGRDATYDSIMEYYQGTNEPCYQFKVKFEAKDSNIKPWKKYQKIYELDLPDNWKTNIYSGHFGSDIHEEEFVCYGPESTTINAIEAVDQYYNGFNGKIKWNTTIPEIRTDCKDAE